MDEAEQLGSCRHSAIHSEHCRFIKVADANERSFKIITYIAPVPLALLRCVNSCWLPLLLNPVILEADQYF